MSLNTMTETLDGEKTIAPVPAQETVTVTKRQRMHHAIKLNQERFDIQMAPVIQEIDQLPTAERAALRVLFTLASKAMHVDFAEHPSAILMLLLHALNDSAFNNLWTDFKPLLKWVDQGE